MRDVIEPAQWASEKAGLAARGPEACPELRRGLPGASPTLCSSNRASIARLCWTHNNRRQSRSTRDERIALTVARNLDLVPSKQSERGESRGVLEER